VRINETIRTPDIAEPRPGGGMFFYNRQTNLIVIIDPSRRDHGTAFPSPGGMRYARDYIEKKLGNNKP